MKKSFFLLILVSLCFNFSVAYSNVKSYKKGKGVTNLNLKLEDGEFNFLIGPTGSGKTTLMRLIYFDLIPDSGTLIVNDFK